MQHRKNRLAVFIAFIIGRQQENSLFIYYFAYFIFLTFYRLHMLSLHLDINLLINIRVTFRVLIALLIYRVCAFSCVVIRAKSRHIDLKIFF